MFNSLEERKAFKKRQHEKFMQETINESFSSMRGLVIASLLSLLIFFLIALVMALRG